MKRIRRVSIEFVRRELSLSVSRSTGRNAESRPGSKGQCEDEVRKNPSPQPECPQCASPWFMLPAVDGEKQAIIQRALERHGIHNELCSNGELLVCGKTFELHTGAFDATNDASKEMHIERNNCIPRKASDHE